MYVWVVHIKKRRTCIHGTKRLRFAARTAQNDRLKYLVRNWPNILCFGLGR